MSSSINTIPGSVNTFRAYGITCIFILAAFIAVNVYLERHGIQVESHQPHETHDQQVTFDPHGVPSSLVKDLSSSKLKPQDEPVMSYGSTLGTDHGPSGQTRVAEDRTQTGADDDFNPRAGEYGYETRSGNTNSSRGNKTTDDFNPRAGEYGYDTRSGTSNTSRGNRPDQTGYEQSDYNRRDSRESRDRSMQPNEQSNTDYDGYRNQGDQQYQGQSRDDYRSGQQSNNNGQDEMDANEYRRMRPKQDSPRRHSIEHSEPRQHERKERRRRPSGDIEGMREREDQMAQREQRDSRRHGEDSRRHGDDKRGGESRQSGRRSSRHRRSMEGEQFQDFDPNPREKIVFEQLPDIASRSPQPRPQPRSRDPRDEDSYSRQSDPYRQY